MIAIGMFGLKYRTKLAFFALPRLTSFPRTMIRPLVKKTSSRICNMSIPTRPLQGGQDELRADVSFGEGALVHGAHTLPRLDRLTCLPSTLPPGRSPAIWPVVINMAEYATVSGIAE